MFMNAFITVLIMALAKKSSSVVDLFKQYCYTNSLPFSLLGVWCDVTYVQTSVWIDILIIDLNDNLVEAII